MWDGGDLMVKVYVHFFHEKREVNWEMKEDKKGIWTWEKW